MTNLTFVSRDVENYWSLGADTGGTYQHPISGNATITRDVPVSLVFHASRGGGCALASGESFFQVIPAAYLHDITPYEAK